MHLRLILSSIVLAALAANPCFAKGGHAQHGARASASSNGASGKGASGGNPAPSEAKAPTDTEAAIAPPVLPPHGVTRRQIPTINPGPKTANPTNASRNQTGAIATVPIPRNAIGQSVAPRKNFVGVQPAVSPVLQGAGPVSPISHGGPVAASVSSGALHASSANGSNRGSVNGATVVRPAAAPSVIGGAARARFGINGTTVQSRH